MKKSFPILLALGSFSFCFGQQNNEFKALKQYYDRQRSSLIDAFKQELRLNPGEENIQRTKEEFVEFMTKLDSIQNVSSINALIETKNRETLAPSQSKTLAKEEKKHLGESMATYPGGIDALRKQVSELFYYDAISDNPKRLSTEITFIVEKDGSISNVVAKGDSSVFNRQAEIAVYMLPDTFSPASINGQPVRYRFRMPLNMNFE